MGVDSGGKAMVLALLLALVAVHAITDADPDALSLLTLGSLHKAGETPFASNEVFMLQEDLVGAGTFGAVFRAIWYPASGAPAVEVALKMASPTEDDSLRQLTSEITMMGKIWEDEKNPPVNIIRSLGWMLAPIVSYNDSHVTSPTLQLNPVDAPDGGLLKAFLKAKSSRLEILLKQANKFPANSRGQPLRSLAASRGGGVPARSFVDTPADGELAVYLVLDMCSGSDLHDLYWSADAPFDNRDNVFYAVRNLLLAVNFLSTRTPRRGVVTHRDLKLSNLLACDSIEETKVIDFGLAAITGQQSHALSATEIQNYCGTPETAAPETACKMKKHCPDEFTQWLKDPTNFNDENLYSKDIWSVGVVFAQLLSSRSRPSWVFEGRQGQRDNALAEIVLSNIMQACSASSAKVAPYHAKFPAHFFESEFGRDSNVMKAMRGMLTCLPKFRIKPQTALDLLLMSELNPSYRERCQITCAELCPVDDDACFEDCFDLVAAPNRPKCEGIELRARCPICQEVVHNLKLHNVAKHSNCPDVDSALFQMICTYNNHNDTNPCDVNAKTQEYYPETCKTQCRQIHAVRQAYYSTGDVTLLCSEMQDLGISKILSGQITKVHVAEAKKQYRSAKPWQRAVSLLGSGPAVKTGNR
eukprot:gnl/Hemi2/21036_TR6982_c0_g1_i1.p1 gnl/Hemi2/21036_TR6982_c0_g1~~gnl/Hemi2/21036_TR6982_c0_g1_i1.p1  ORF type:complete len:653 (+),score=61.99 gnl/Hemi2/21036_TR6982_c0_g1_i1:33-1961(+)